MKIIYNELKYITDTKESEDMGYVYVLYNPESNLVKIGKTKSPHRRFSELSNQAGSKFRYYITEPIFIETIVERVMHNKFATKRVKGEWFSSVDFDFVVSTLKGVLDSDDFNKRNIKH